MKYLEILLASSLFYVSCKNKMDELIMFTSDVIALPPVDDLAVKELETSSGNMFSVAELIDDFELESDEELDVFDDIKEDICFSCDNYDECWDKNYDETSDEIFNLIENTIKAR